MCCLLLVIASGAPRVALVLMWLFSDLMERAYTTWILPALGFVFLPWTTIFYALAFQWPTPGVSGIGWFFVAFGFLLDLGSYSGGAKRGQQSRA